MPEKQRGNWVLIIDKLLYKLCHRILEYEILKHFFSEKVEHWIFFKMKLSWFPMLC